MNTITRYFLCLGLLTTTFSVESAYKTTKLIFTGVGFVTTGYAAIIVKNYVQCPDSQLAKAATIKDIDDARIAACKYVAPAHASTTQNLEYTKKALVEYAAHAQTTTVKTIDEGTTTLLESSLFKNPARAFHMSLYPKKEDCPSVAKYDTCPAHDVNIPEGLLINAAKIVKTQLK